MSLEFIEDPKARERSLMHKQLPLCNGEATGCQCKHYWAITKKVDVPNSDQLRKGENIRYCLVDTSDATFLGNNGADMAVYCNRYEKSERFFDPNYEVYNPLTPEETLAMGATLPKPADAVTSPGSIFDPTPASIFDEDSK